MHYLTTAHTRAVTLSHLKTDVKTSAFMTEFQIDMHKIAPGLAKRINIALGQRMRKRT